MRKSQTRSGTGEKISVVRVVGIAGRRAFVEILNERSRVIIYVVVARIGNLALVRASIRMRANEPNGGCRHAVRRLSRGVERAGIIDVSPNRDVFALAVDSPNLQGNGVSVVESADQVVEHGIAGGDVPADATEINVLEESAPFDIVR